MWNFLKICFQKIFPRTYQDHKDKDEEEILRTVSLSFLHCLVVSIPISFADFDNLVELSYDAVPVILLYFFILTIVRIYAKHSQNIDNIKKDIKKWPLYVHKHIVFWTIISVLWLFYRLLNINHNNK